MRSLMFALPLLAVAMPAAAQDTTEETGDDLARVERTLGDPARQEAAARAMGAMAEVLLDIPLAPIIAPIAEAAGEDPRRVDPDTTLRKMSPRAGNVPRQIERALPRAMGAMAGMSGAFADLLPQLREAVEKVRDTLPDELP